jgi:hypothetical protein
MNKEILRSPDDAGWHFYQKSAKSPMIAVYVSEDGECFAMDETGESWTMDETIGRWVVIDFDKLQ